MKLLAVEEILGKAESGVTEPYLCRLSDGRLYYVKGASATARGLMSEALCGNLGRSFGLPVPDSALVRLDHAVLQYDEGARRSLGVGVAFASLKQPSIHPVTSSSLSFVPTELQQRLFVFDHWIRNEDRTVTEYGGNPNLFLSLPTHSPVVIDHNLAFDPNYDLANNLRLHVCREAWLDGRGDLLLSQQLRDTMEPLVNAAKGFAADLPEQWLDAAPEAVEGMIDTLARCQTADFWSALNE